jgi:hypothetical protein
MKAKLFNTFLVVTMLAIAIVPAASAAPLQAGGSPFIRQISSAITTSFPAGNQGPDVSVQTPEIRGEERAGEAGTALRTNGNQNPVGRSASIQNGSDSSDPLRAPRVKGSPIAGSNPGLFSSFLGLNHRDQRLANGGNQFSIEPPDQGLCVGNGYVLETINDVLRVFDPAGNPLTGVISLNEFYGYLPAINRTTGEFGPFVTDPSCIFDAATQRWFHVVLTLDVDPATGDFLGSNHIDIAVSKTANPTGNWVVYRLPAQNDGTDGTPDHGCSFGPCIGDFPHIGADQYGFYITTNEYSFFGPEFTAAQLYALSKKDLAANKNRVTVVLFDTTGEVDSASGDQPGFTVWPAISPDSVYNTQARGTEFFLSSNAGEEANGVPGGSFSNEVIVWALTNTKSLDTNSPDLKLSNKVLESEVYGVPPKSEQKPGPFPLGQCINNTGLRTPFGRGCWQILFVTEPAHNEVISRLDSSDSRMMQVWYANGLLWGALDTVVKVGEKKLAGIAYFIVQPTVNNNGAVAGSIAKQGYVAVTGNNVTYPAIAVLPNGKGIMAFTLVGKNYYPSAAYVSIDVNGTGDIHIAAAGLGVSDGFTSYKAFVGDPPRTRWGDYGAAVTDGSNIWIASEYIAQTCTFAQYTAGVSQTSLGAFGSCGGTRTSLANWATRISGVTP